MSIATWVEDALAVSTAAECVVSVAEQTQANLRWAGNSLTTNGQMHARTGTVTAIVDVEGGRAAGTVSGPVTSADDLLALVRAADAAAAASPASDEAMDLPEGRVDDDFAEPATGTSIEVFAQLAAGLGQAFEAARADGHLLFGFAEHQLTTTWLATSAGVRRRHVQPMGRIELNAKQPDMIASAWVGQATVDFTDVDAEALHADVLTRLGWCDNRVDLPAGRYETLLPPSAVADLLIYAYWTMNGRDADEGRNVFAGSEPGTNRIGEKLTELLATLSSGPGLEGLPCAPFAVITQPDPGMESVFDNGADVPDTSWITDGVLTQLVRTRQGAAKAGVSGFPFPAWNLRLDAGGTATLDEMIKATKRGLLLTCLWYIREVDPETLLLTGLTRDGVYLVEDGEVVGMVNNFRFNESPVDLLRRASEASRTEPTLCREWNDWFTYTAMPALRVPDFNMSTVSKAH